MARPMLKGVLHAIAAIFYIFLTPTLINLIPIGLELPLYSYIITMIVHFAASALLHLISWSPNILPYIRRLDHVIIFLKISAMYYACITTVMPDINVLVIYTFVSGTILGILIRIFFTDIHVALIGIPYLLVGWSLILDPNIPTLLVQRIPVGAFIGFLGGLCYTIGAIIYMLRYPNPFPKYIGFHEIFHILTTVGTVLFTISIFSFAVPFYISSEYPTQTISALNIK